MARRVRRRVKVEIDWPCSSCGTINKGRDMSCVACGNGKGTDEKYVIPETIRPEDVVTDADRLRQANAGAHWACKSCGYQVRRTDNSCARCGMPEVDPSDLTPPPPPQPPPLPRYEYAEPGRNGGADVATAIVGFLPMLGIAIVVFGLIALGVWLFASKEVEVTVTSISWKYEVELERKKVMRGEGWGTPFGAYDASCERRQHGTEDCNPYECNERIVKYNCNPHDCNPHKKTVDCNPKDCNCHIDRSSCVDDGTGYATCDEVCDTCYDECSETVYDTCYETCTRKETDTCYEQCPVYDDYCTYKYDEWPTVATDSKIGLTHEVEWPPLVAKGANERLQKKETYGVVFANSEDSWELYPGTYNEFTRYNQSARWLIKVNRAGSVEPLHPI